MTAYYDPAGSDYGHYEHDLKKRHLRASGDYDKNVRYVLEDIAIQLGRIADALEGDKTND